MTNTKELVDSFLKQQELCIEKISQQTDLIIQIIDALTKAQDNGKKIFTMGNGGSASTSSHFVSDLLKTSITKEKKRFEAISLVDNIPVILAWANDVSYEDIFVEQLANFLSDGDIIIGFSGSGKSKNVIKAMEYGKKKGAFCIGITGMSGGSFPTICDLCFIVPSNDMLAIESIHVMLCHCIVTAIREMGTPVFKYE
ncbi:MAG: SIS domain-containing protein [Nitrosopumilales archaeon]|nr:MAG: SIS domain-containing protein [Nitrosopumilales archaeon]